MFLTISGYRRYKIIVFRRTLARGGYHWSDSTVDFYVVWADLSAVALWVIVRDKGNAWSILPQSLNEGRENKTAFQGSWMHLMTRHLKYAALLGYSLLIDKHPRNPEDLDFQFQVCLIRTGAKLCRTVPGLCLFGFDYKSLQNQTQWNEVERELKWWPWTAIEGKFIWIRWMMGYIWHVTR